MQLDNFLVIVLKKVECMSYMFKMVVLMQCRETPVLISNTEVKLTLAYGTAGLYWWESGLVPPS